MQVVADNFIHGNTTISSFSESDGLLGSEGLKITRVAYVKTYMHKVIRGVGEVQLEYRYGRDGLIEFTGYELFSGAIGESKGSLIFDISGKANPDSGTLSAQQQLRRGSGSSELYDCYGKGSYVVARNGHCSFELTLSN